MKVIITGGTGLIGKPLSNKLAADGHQVIILSRSLNRPPGLSGDIEIARWDAKTGDGWSHLLEDTDAIVNLAGSNLSGGRWTDERKQLILQSRLDAGAAIVDGVRSSGHVPGLLIQASGISYYGHREHSYVDESDPPGTDFLARVCVEWEQSTQEVETLGTRRIILRTGPVLNLQEGALPPLAMPFFLFAGGRTGKGTQGLSWIHVEDEVDAIHFLLLQRDLNGPFNICAPHPVSNQEFARTIGNVMNRPAVFPVPERVMRGALGEVADVILLGQYAVPKRLKAAGYDFRYPELEEALKDLLSGQSRIPGNSLFRRGARMAVRMLLP